ncbi:His-Xaa-Ser system protein HxsD [Thermodesulfobacteriota bacterium]
MQGQMITKNEDGSLLVVLSKRIYDKPAVLRASYSISNFCIVDMQPKGDNDVAITIESKPGQESFDLESIAHRFCNEVVDQQIRLDLEKRTKGIREIIIRHAFEPISDLTSAVEDAD